MFKVIKNQMMSNYSRAAEIGPKPLWNATFTDKLRHALLLNYDKFARPAQHYNVTTVQFNVRFRHFEINESSSTLTAHCWLQVVSLKFHIIILLYM